MIIKIISLFLIAMGVLAMFGKLSLADPRRLTGTKCKRCGRYRIGKGPCPCTKTKG